MRSHGSLSLAFLFVCACSEAAGTTAAGKSSEPTGSAASNTAPRPAVSASASSAAAAALPADADAAVIAELKKFQSCTVGKLGFERGCAALHDENGFKAFSNNYITGDTDSAKVKKLMKSCLALSSDADQKLRLASAECINDMGFYFNDDATAGARVLSAVETEHDELVRGRWISALHELKLSGENATRAVDLLKKLKLTDDGRKVVPHLLKALAHGEPIDGAIDEAILLAGDAEYTVAYSALDLLERVTTRAPEACKAAEAVVVGKKRRWSQGANTLVVIKPACKFDDNAVVTAIAEKLGEEDKDGALERGAKMLELARFVGKAKLSPAHKAKISSAVTARAGKKLADEEDEIEDLKKALRK